MPLLIIIQVYEELGQMLSPALGHSLFSIFWNVFKAMISKITFKILFDIIITSNYISYSILYLKILGEEDERTEILLAATFLLIVILAFIGFVLLQPIIAIECILFLSS